MTDILSLVSGIASEHLNKPVPADPTGLSVYRAQTILVMDAALALMSAVESLSVSTAIFQIVFALASTDSSLRVHFQTEHAAELARRGRGEPATVAAQPLLTPSAGETKRPTGDAVMDGAQHLLAALDAKELKFGPDPATAAAAYRFDRNQPIGLGQGRQMQIVPLADAGYRLLTTAKVKKAIEPIETELNAFVRNNRLSLMAQHFSSFYYGVMIHWMSEQKFDDKAMCQIIHDAIPTDASFERTISAYKFYSRGLINGLAGMFDSSFDCPAVSDFSADTFAKQIVDSFIGSLQIPYRGQTALPLLLATAHVNLARQYLELDLQTETTGAIAYRNLEAAEVKLLQPVLERDSRASAQPTADHFGKTCKEMFTELMNRDGVELKSTDNRVIGLYSTLDNTAIPSGLASRIAVACTRLTAMCFRVMQMEDAYSLDARVRHRPVAEIEQFLTKHAPDILCRFFVNDWGQETVKSVTRTCTELIRYFSRNNAIIMTLDNWTSSQTYWRRIERAESERLGSAGVVRSLMSVRSEDVKKFVRANLATDCALFVADFLTQFVRDISESKDLDEGIDQKGLVSRFEAMRPVVGPVILALCQAVLGQLRQDTGEQCLVCAVSLPTLVLISIFSDRGLIVGEERLSMVDELDPDIAWRALLSPERGGPSFVTAFTEKLLANLGTGGELRMCPETINSVCMDIEDSISGQSQIVSRVTLLAIARAFYGKGLSSISDFVAERMCRSLPNAFASTFVHVAGTSQQAQAAYVSSVLLLHLQKGFHHFATQFLLTLHDSGVRDSRRMPLSQRLPFMSTDQLSKFIGWCFEDFMKTKLEKCMLTGQFAGSLDTTLSIPRLLSAVSLQAHYEFRGRLYSGVRMTYRDLTEQVVQHSLASAACHRVESQLPMSGYWTWMAQKLPLLISKVLLKWRGAENGPLHDEYIRHGVIGAVLQRLFATEKLGSEAGLASKAAGAAAVYHSGTKGIREAHAVLRLILDVVVFQPSPVWTMPDYPTPSDFYPVFQHELLQEDTKTTGRMILSPSSGARDTTDAVITALKCLSQRYGREPAVIMGYLGQPQSKQAFVSVDPEELTAIVRGCAVEGWSSSNKTFVHLVFEVRSRVGFSAARVWLEDKKRARAGVALVELWPHMDDETEAFGLVPRISAITRDLPMSLARTGSILELQRDVATAQRIRSSWNEIRVGLRRAAAASGVRADNMSAFLKGDDDSSKAGRVQGLLRRSILARYLALAVDNLPRYPGGDEFESGLFAAIRSMPMLFVPLLDESVTEFGRRVDLPRQDGEWDLLKLLVFYHFMSEMIVGSFVQESDEELDPISKEPIKVAVFLSEASGKPHSVHVFDKSSAEELVRYNSSKLTMKCPLCFAELSTASGSLHVRFREGTEQEEPVLRTVPVHVSALSVEAQVKRVIESLGGTPGSRANAVLSVTRPLQAMFVGDERPDADTAKTVASLLVSTSVECRAIFEASQMYAGYKSDFLHALRSEFGTSTLEPDESTFIDGCVEVFARRLRPVGDFWKFDGTALRAHVSAVVGALFNGGALVEEIKDADLQGEQKNEDGPVQQKGTKKKKKRARLGAVARRRKPTEAAVAAPVPASAPRNNDGKRTTPRLEDMPKALLLVSGWPVWHGASPIIVPDPMYSQEDMRHIGIVDQIECATASGMIEELHARMREMVKRECAFEFMYGSKMALTPEFRSQATEASRSSNSLSTVMSPESVRSSLIGRFDFGRPGVKEMANTILMYIAAERANLETFQGSLERWVYSTRESRFVFSAAGGSSGFVPNAWVGNVIQACKSTALGQTWSNAQTVRSLHQFCTDYGYLMTTLSMERKEVQTTRTFANVETMVLETVFNAPGPASSNAMLTLIKAQRPELVSDPDFAFLSSEKLAQYSRHFAPFAMSDSSIPGLFSKLVSMNATMQSTTGVMLTMSEAISPRTRDAAVTMAIRWLQRRFNVSDRDLARCISDLKSFCDGYDVEAALAAKATDARRGGKLAFAGVSMAVGGVTYKSTDLTCITAMVPDLVQGVPRPPVVFSQAYVVPVEKVAPRADAATSYPYLVHENRIVDRYNGMAPLSPISRTDDPASKDEFFARTIPYREWDSLVEAMYSLLFQPVGTGFGWKDAAQAVLNAFVDSMKTEAELTLSQYTDQYISQFLPVLQNSGLRVLDLSNSVTVTDTAMQSVSGMPFLEYLSVSGCKKLSFTAMRAVRDMPNLKAVCMDGISTRTPVYQRTYRDCRMLQTMTTDVVIPELLPLFRMDEGEPQLAFSGCPNLTKLFARRVDITDEVAFSIAALSLKELDLRLCEGFGLNVNLQAIALADGGEVAVKSAAELKVEEEEDDTWEAQQEARRRSFIYANTGIDIDNPRGGLSLRSAKDFLAGKGGMKNKRPKKDMIALESDSRRRKPKVWLDANQMNEKYLAITHAKGAMAENRKTLRSSDRKREEEARVYAKLRRIDDEDDAKREMNEVVYNAQHREWQAENKNRVRPPFIDLRYRVRATWVTSMTRFQILFRGTALSKSVQKLDLSDADCDSLEYLRWCVNLRDLAFDRCVRITPLETAPQVCKLVSLSATDTKYCFGIAKDSITEAEIQEAAAATTMTTGMVQFGMGMVQFRSGEPRMHILASVNLRGCTSIGKEAVSLLAFNAPRVRTLVMADCDLSDQTAAKLAGRSRLALYRGTDTGAAAAASLIQDGPPTVESMIRIGAKSGSLWDSEYNDSVTAGPLRLRVYRTIHDDTVYQLMSDLEVLDLSNNARFTGIGLSDVWSAYRARFINAEGAWVDLRLKAFHDRIVKNTKARAESWGARNGEAAGAAVEAFLGDLMADEQHRLQDVQEVPARQSEAGLTVPRLRVLDVSGCPDLRLDLVCAALDGIESLEEIRVSQCVAGGSSVATIDDAKRVIASVKSSLPGAINAVADHVVITFITSGLAAQRATVRESSLREGETEPPPVQDIEWDALPRIMELMENPTAEESKKPARGSGVLKQVVSFHQAAGFLGIFSKGAGWFHPSQLEAPTKTFMLSHRVGFRPEWSRHAIGVTSATVDVSVTFLHGDGNAHQIDWAKLTHAQRSMADPFLATVVDMKRDGDDTVVVAVSGESGQVRARVKASSLGDAARLTAEILNRSKTVAAVLAAHGKDQAVVRTRPDGAIGVVDTTALRAMYPVLALQLALPPEEVSGETFELIEAACAEGGTPADVKHSLIVCRDLIDRARRDLVDLNNMDIPEEGMEDVNVEEDEL